MRTRTVSRIARSMFAGVDPQEARWIESKWTNATLGDIWMSLFGRDKVFDLARKWGHNLQGFLKDLAAKYQQLLQSPNKADRPRVPLQEFSDWALYKVEGAVR